MNNAPNYNDSFETGDWAHSRVPDSLRPSRKESPDFLMSQDDSVQFNQFDIDFAGVEEFGIGCDESVAPGSSVSQYPSAVLWPSSGGSIPVDHPPSYTHPKGVTTTTARSPTTTEATSYTLASQRPGRQTQANEAPAYHPSNLFPHRVPNYLSYGIQNEPNNGNLCRSAPALASPLALQQPRYRPYYSEPNTPQLVHKKPETIDITDESVSVSVSASVSPNHGSKHYKKTENTVLVGLAYDQMFVNPSLKKESWEQIAKNFNSFFDKFNLSVLNVFEQNKNSDSSRTPDSLKRHFKELRKTNLLQQGAMFKKMYSDFIQLRQRLQTQNGQNQNFDHQNQYLHHQQFFFPTQNSFQSTDFFSQ